MYRLSPDLVKELMHKMRKPKLHEDLGNAFTHSDLNSIGVIDPHAAVGTNFHYSIESPLPVMFPATPYEKVNVDGFFLYKREELQGLTEQPWTLNKAIIDPLCQDHTEQMDAADCAIVLPTDIDKLTCKTLNTLDQLLKHEPLIVDCLNMEKK